MARKRKLDAHVSVFVDRHGKERFRFRRGGFSCYLPHPSDKDYRAAYEAAKEKQRPRIEPRASPNTVSGALARYYESVGFNRGSEEWRKTKRAVLEGFRERFGKVELRYFEPCYIDRILAEKMRPQIVNGRKIGGTSAARRLREQLDQFFRFCVRQKLIATNPAAESEEVEHKGKGFYAWTEDDIGKFRAHWPLGSKPRLALELVLWTGARRGNAHRAAPPRNGRIGFAAVKTGKEMDVPVAPALQAAIDAMPAVGLTTLLVTEYGKPFTRNGFGNWFKDKCVKAGLPQCSLHGLRKALARRVAERGASQQQLKAVGQWSGDREAALYIEGANRNRLAADALEAVVAWEQDQNIV